MSGIAISDLIKDEYLASLNFDGNKNGYLLDRSLTITGMAPDSKVVGDRFKQVEANIKNIENEMSNLSYVPISITSFTNNKNIVEIGTIINEVIFSWQVSKTPAQLYIDNTSIDSSLTTYTLNNLNLSSNKTFTLKAVENNGSYVEKTTTITFCASIYYGSKEEPSSYDSAFTQNLTKKLNTNNTITFSVNASTNQYIYYICPTTYGTPTFKFGGQEVDFVSQGNITINNIQYIIYKNNQKGLGQTTIEVK